MRAAQDTHLRYLAMLQCMPLGRLLSVKAISDRLVERGFPRVSDRTIQRDLMRLSVQFGLEEITAHRTRKAWRRTRSLETVSARDGFRLEAA